MSIHMKITVKSAGTSLYSFHNGLLYGVIPFSRVLFGSVLQRTFYGPFAYGRAMRYWQKHYVNKKSKEN